jgi:hypothetical protein
MFAVSALGRAAVSHHAICADAEVGPAVVSHHASFAGSETERSEKDLTFWAAVSHHAIFAVPNIECAE